MLRNIIVELLLLCVSGCACQNLLELLVGPKIGHEQYFEPVSNITIVNLTSEAGYPLQTHEVVTEDGYILKVHRIPEGKRKTRKNNRPPVILVHGLLDSSEIWLLLGANFSPGFVMAEGGYDIWLLNVRGNTNSRRHKTLNPNRDSKYWNFSLQEMGYYDLAATIDYVLGLTKQKSTYLIGYSMGGAINLILCSERPEYNEKVRMMINFAPFAYIRHSFAAFTTAGYQLIAPAVIELLKAGNIYEALPNRQYIADIFRSICDSNPVMCLTFIQMNCGYDPNLSPEAISLSWSFYPAGTSRNTILHHIQFAATGKFEKLYIDSGFDVESQSQDVTGLEYNVSQITAPMILYYGEEDLIVPKEDLTYLASRVQKPVTIYRTPGFGHVSFVYSKEVKRVVLKGLIALMDRYR